MHKVFVYDQISNEIVKEGECDGKLHDQYYVKVNGDYNFAGATFLDTPERREQVKAMIERVAKAKQELLDAQGMLYAIPHMRRDLKMAG